MELRELYKEKEIKINATLLDKRKKSLQKILTENCLNSSEWRILAKWEIGIEEEETEELLIKLEEIFCEEDQKFSKDDKKEMHILAENLIYEYSCETENRQIPLMILCGYDSGYQIASLKMYREFEKLLNGWRLDVRNIEDLDRPILLDNAQKIVEILLDVQNEEPGREVTDNNWGNALEVLNYYGKAIEIMASKCDVCEKKIEVQREESDILWWLINEWCTIYQQSFRVLSKEQLVLAAPLELRKMIPYYLGPYAIKQVLYKAISLAQGEDELIKLSQVIDMLDEGVLRTLNLDTLYVVNEVQPVMMAIWCKKEYGSENWKSIFIKKCKTDPDNILKKAEAFAYQFYLELELGELPIE